MVTGLAKSKRSRGRREITQLASLVGDDVRGDVGRKDVRASNYIEIIPLLYLRAAVISAIWRAFSRTAGPRAASLFLVNATGGRPIAGEKRGEERASERTMVVAVVVVVVGATERNVEWMEQMVARAKVNRILLTTLT